MAAPTLKSTLNHYLQRPASSRVPAIRPGLTEADRAHLKRWLKEVRDPMWEQLAADTRRYGELPPVVEGPYSIFISSALRARQFAESQTDSPAVQRKRKQQREQQERSDLLALAEKMEDVVRHRQSCRKAQHPQRVPSPTGPLPDLPQEAEAKRSLEWLRREAQQAPASCREEGVLADGRAELGRGPIPFRVSGRVVERESAISRANWVCSCREMVNCMYQWCGQPRYDAVADDDEHCIS